MDESLYVLSVSYTDKDFLQAPHKFLVLYQDDSSFEKSISRSIGNKLLRLSAEELAMSVKPHMSFRKYQRKLRKSLQRDDLIILGEILEYDAADKSGISDAADIWLPKDSRLTVFHDPSMSATEIKGSDGGGKPKKHNGVPGRPCRIGFIDQYAPLVRITPGYEYHRFPIEDTGDEKLPFISAIVRLFS
jgi:hypothetical protein